MLHHKSTQNFYRDLESDLQYFSNMENANNNASNASDYELYEILAEYDEMQRKSENDSDKTSS